MGWPEGRLAEIARILPPFREARRGDGRGNPRLWEIDRLEMISIIVNHFGVGFTVAAKLACQARWVKGEIVLTLPAAPTIKGKSYQKNKASYEPI